jgi:hypothetical protein
LKQPLEPERCGCIDEDNSCLVVESGLFDYPHDKKLFCSIKDYKKCEIYIKAFQQQKGAMIEYLLNKKLHDEQTRK